MSNEKGGGWGQGLVNKLWFLLKVLSLQGMGLFLLWIKKIKLDRKCCEVGRRELYPQVFAAGGGLQTEDWFNKCIKNFGGFVRALL